MVNEATHYNCINNNSTHDYGGSISPPFFKENDYGINARGQKGHDKKINYKLQIRVAIS